MRRMSDCEGTGLSYAGVGASLSPLPAPVSSLSPDVLDHCRPEHLIVTEQLGNNDAQETTEK